jgi:hypothetical protein
MPPGPGRMADHGRYRYVERAVERAFAQKSDLPVADHGATETRHDSQCNSNQNFQ